MSKQYLDCYRRVSTTEQKKSGNSLEVQHDLGVKVSKKLGLKFRDRNEGSRSSTTQYREVLEQLKEDIEKGKVKNIWCQDRTRMFRDMEGLMFKRDYLIKYDINLYEGESGILITFDSDDDNLMYDIITRVGQYENEVRNTRSQRGIFQRLEKYSSIKPVFIGGTSLFGYKSVDKLWTIHKEEKKWVEKIFDMYETGSTVKDIKNELDKNGVETRRGGLWSLGTLQKMLRNKTYTGIHSVHIKRKNRTFTYKTPSIISVSQFNRVQKVLNKNQKNKDNNKKHFGLLTDFLKCECGTNYGSEIKKKKLIKREVVTKKYYCMNKLYEWKDGKDRGCRNKKSLDMNRTNESLVEIIKKTVSDSHILKERYKNEVLDSKVRTDKEVSQKRLKLEEKCQRIQSQVENIENQIVDLEVDIGLGKRDRSRVQKVINRYEHELDNQHTEYSLIEEELEKLDSEIVWTDWLGRFGKELKIRTKDEKKQKDWLDGIVTKIVVNSEMSLDRNDKETQTGHSFDIHFKMGIVNDKMKYFDEGDKTKGYNVKSGRKVKKTGLLEEVTSKRGRVWVKKN